MTIDSESGNKVWAYILSSQRLDEVLAWHRLEAWYNNCVPSTKKREVVEYLVMRK